MLLYHLNDTQLAWNIYHWTLFTSLYGADVDCFKLKLVVKIFTINVIILIDKLIGLLSVFFLYFRNVLKIIFLTLLFNILSFFSLLFDFTFGHRLIVNRRHRLVLYSAHVLFFIIKHEVFGIWLFFADDNFVLYQGFGFNHNLRISFSQFSVKFQSRFWLCVLIDLFNSWSLSFEILYIEFPS